MHPPDCVPGRTRADLVRNGGALCAPELYRFDGSKRLWKFKGSNDGRAVVGPG
jgi:hypothetical protein